MYFHIFWLFFRIAHKANIWLTAAAQASTKIPWIPKNAWNPGGFSLSVKARLTKKETGFRLSRMVREGGVEGLESTPKLLGLPWSFGFGGRCSPSLRRR